MPRGRRPRARRSSRGARSRCHERLLHGQHHRDRGQGPRDQHGGPITLFARTPSSRAVSKSSDAARICRPTVVLPRNSTSATRQTIAVTIATTVIFRTSVPDRPGQVQLRERRRRLASVSRRTGRSGARRPAGGNATANVATSIVAADCVRSGGRPHAPSRATARHDEEAERDAAPDGPVAVGGEGQSEAPAAAELPVGEVDEAQHAEDEADADRHQRVDRADADRVHLHLGVDSRAQEVGEPAGERAGRGTPGSSARCRRRRRASGSAAPRRSPAPACDSRSDGALRALLDEEHAIPSSRIVSSASKTRSMRSARDRATARRAGAPPGRDERACDRELLLLPAGEDARMTARNSATTGNISMTRSTSSAPSCDRRPEPEPEVLLDGQLAEDRRPSGTSATPLPRDGLRRPPARRAPSGSTSPPEARTRPMIACRVVDFPAPFGPMSPTISPAGSRATRRERPPPRRSAPRGRRRRGGGAAQDRPLVDGALAEVRGRDVEVGADLRGRALGERPALVEHVDPARRRP